MPPPEAIRGTPIPYVAYYSKYLNWPTLEILSIFLSIFPARRHRIGRAGFPAAAGERWAWELLRPLLLRRRPRQKLTRHTRAIPYTTRFTCYRV
eukprot:9504091-Pyramimonas_sp.AAC.3